MLILKLSQKRGDIVMPPFFFKRANEAYSVGVKIATLAIATKCNKIVTDLPA